ncbi:MAG: cobyric acid synthase [Lautropia sp.]|nr:cobyric acid synthase [Lautropia sp.]
MVLGTTSGAGKSWICTALCRWYARQGLRVAPFKAQNMSNNARVVSGGEIGSAQYFQALAAGVEPSVQMNPVLLKPEADTRSQVILLGEVNDALGAMPWRERHHHTWPVISAALDALRATHDVVVIEGAGSPAEINLHSTDVVNLRVARHADAACLLVSDIDRGGAFAHLYGTWALMPEADRRLLRGFVLNRFRGDASLLAPAPEIIEEKTGVPVVATVPMWRGHGLPEEDGWFQYRDRQAPRGGEVPAPVSVGPEGHRATRRRGRRIFLIAPPRISNLDEFEPLSGLEGVELIAVRGAGMLPAPDDWIILPGSKHTSSDLAWLKRQGLDTWVVDHAMRGGPVLGICGGLQMLGKQLHDPHGVDGTAEGLGLLPLETVFEPEKVLQRRSLHFGAVPGVWQAASGVAVSGYEIHQGQTKALTGKGPAVAVLPDGLGWCNAAGNVLGIYLHGIFENDALLRALLGRSARPLPAVFDGLADHVEASFRPGVLMGLLRPACQG